MNLMGGVFLTAITFLATFYYTVWVGRPLLLFYPPQWAILAVPTVVAVVTSVLVWRQSAAGGTLESGRRLGTGVWVWYLSTGAVLAVTRVALLVWVNHQRARDIYTETVVFIGNWLYPEEFVTIVWRSLVGFDGTKYYLAWGSLIAVGSFVMATPILLVGWLRQRRG